MGHEHFADERRSQLRPAAALARQLLSTGKVDSIYMYGNIVSVDISKGSTADGCPTSCATCTSTGSQHGDADVRCAAEEAAAPAAADGGRGATESPYTKLVPQALRERSAAALAKWQASQ
jgi:hypothetical protein